MSQVHFRDVAERPAQVMRRFSGQRQQAGQPPPADLPPENQAALRQFSLERMMAYGVHHADAVELRGRVWAGEDWQAVATELADTCLAPAEGCAAPQTAATRANRLYRASALLRMSQMMMLSDGEARSAIMARAGDLYADGALITGDRERVRIETSGGPLAGWIYAARFAVGTAVVIGGVEGWAMDFEGLGLALSRRGVETLLLDGPGQGESRMVHGHVLRPGWEGAYDAAFSFLSQRCPGRPMAFIGNSMGGAVALHLAARNPRIAVCCDNGGPKAPGRPPAPAGAGPAPPNTFFQKMMAHCGTQDEALAAGVWESVRPLDPRHPIRCPLLIVQGGLDPMVSNADAEAIFAAAASADKQLVIFSDGDHCVYNHADDKHNLIGDWVRDRLEQAAA